MASKRKRKKKKTAEKSAAALKRRAAPAMRAALWLLAAVVVIGLAAFGASAGYEAAVRKDYFDVRNVEFSGLSLLSEKYVRDLVGPVIGENSFDVDIEAIGERMRSRPWIKSVNIRRRLPSTLAVDVVERRPAVVAAFGGGWLMDGEGVLLTKKPEDETWGFPVISGLRPPEGGPRPGAAADSSTVKAALAAMGRLEGFRLFGKNPVAGVDVSRPDRMTILFKGTEARVVAPRGPWADEAERLLVVDHILRKKETRPLSISLMFADKVIVTYPGAQAG
ncbi:MAG: cell division protein FtsQ/DivIB [Candidatus Nitrospinota bacterium M3_3B_026]